MDISLTDKELKEIREEARRLEIEEQKKVLRDKMLAEERARLRATVDPSEETRSILIDLAEYADRIVVDGVIYFHGQTYVVPKRKFDVLAEAMFRTQQHEHEVSGKTRQQFKPRPPVQLRPGMEGMPTSALNRAVGAV